jgi:pimeloyl-ACP methyl ester carboxylesterase
MTDIKHKFNLNDWLSEHLNFPNVKDNVLKSIHEFSENLLKNSQNRVGDRLLPVLNGFAGHLLHESNDPRAIKMSFRYKNRDVSVSEMQTIYNFSAYKGKICILIHGLFGDEWMWKKTTNQLKFKIGDLLEKQDEYTVLYIRYNTGLHISENGRALSDLLEKFTGKFKEQISDIYLIGHSMGGLLIRSAGYYADIQRQEWTQFVKKIFLIGVPNQGSYLAQTAEFINELFKKADVSKDEVISRFLDIRSNGIKDLAHAYLTDEDWLNSDNNKAEKVRVRPLSGVKYYLIAGTLGKNKIFSTYFGDGLVGSESAVTDELSTSVFTDVKRKVFENKDHISLLSSKLVADYIIENLK